VDAALAAIIGRETASRALISRLLWNYVKAHQLQNPLDGRRFVPDATLATVVGVEGEEMDGFMMMRFVKDHILTGAALAAHQQQQPPPPPPAEEPPINERVGFFFDF
jgi:chromatin remodeling complex protein RSC6